MLNLKKCVKCTMDQSDISISFDENGICNYCNDFHLTQDKIKKYQNIGINNIINEIKNHSLNKKCKYDCIIGLSGGVDSSYVAYLAKSNGLNCLLVHLDNGWNTELSIKNIESIVNYTGYDLHTHVINWNEFKDIQRSFFFANVIDLELITDHAIYASVYKLARQNKVKYLLSGENLSSESIMPSSWNWLKTDKKNIKSIHKKFGKKKLKTYPFMSGFKKIFFQKFGLIKSIPILNYIDYNKSHAKKIIIDEMGWIDYGGKHHESIFTRFYQSYILIEKFGIDKRKAHWSSLINMGQASLEEAQEDLKNKPISDSQIINDRDLVLKKLEFDNEFFNKYLSEKQMDHIEYGSELKIYNLLLKLKNYFK